MTALNTETVLEKRAGGARRLMLGYLLAGVAGVVLWWLLYTRLASIAAALTYSLLGIGRGTHLGAAVEFFLYDTPKVLMLLVGVVFFVGILRSFLHLSGRAGCWPARTS